MHRVRTVLAVLLTFVVAGATSVTAAVAQDATPETTAHDFPLVPDPALCTIEPRYEMEQLLDLWFPADGSPAAMPETPAEVTIPLGSPADVAVQDQVTTTIYSLFSCFVAGDFARAYSYFTENLIRSFGPEPGVSREEVEMFIQASPEAVPEGEEGIILAVTDVQILEDGRVGAFVVDSSTEGTFTVYAIFEEQEDGTYLVDEVIEFTAFAEE